MIERFPVSKQGVQLRRPVKGHELLGKCFYREWIDVQEPRLEVYGLITKCWQGLVDANERFFTVEYADRVEQLRERIPEADNNVSEAAAWGGFIAFERDNRWNQKHIIPLRSPPFHLDWIIPVTLAVDGTPYPTLVTRVGDFELLFYVSQSSIPNAGLGLWVTCKRVSCCQPTTETGFVLQAGELVSIQPYGPLQIEDVKSEFVFLLKNFIHLGSAKSWSFERASHDEAGYIDVTDDWSGELHEKGRNNLVSFANETNGKEEIPNACAIHDPSGAIQIFLGHEHEAYGALTIPANTPTEVKVRTIPVKSD